MLTFSGDSDIFSLSDACQTTWGLCSPCNGASDIFLILIKIIQDSISICLVSLVYCFSFRPFWQRFHHLQQKIFDLMLTFSELSDILFLQGTVSDSTDCPAKTLSIGEKPELSILAPPALSAVSFLFFKSYKILIESI